MSIRYTEHLAETGIKPSVGSVGDSYDNALAETINGLYRAEVFHRRVAATKVKYEGSVLATQHMVLSTRNCPGGGMVVEICSL